MPTELRHAQQAERPAPRVVDTDVRRLSALPAAVATAAVSDSSLTLDTWQRRSGGARTATAASPHALGSGVGLHAELGESSLGELLCGAAGVASALRGGHSALVCKKRTSQHQLVQGCLQRDLPA